MDQIVVRLHPGQDLKKEIDRLVEKQGIKAACILTCVGSLTRAVLRFANQENSKVLEGYFEIVSLTGILSKYGSHCHIAVADERGKTFGAHLMDGCTIYTTAELVIGIIPDCSFLRKFDPQTGYPELDIA